MASRFPSGQDDFRQYPRGTFTYQSRTSSSNSRSFPAPSSTPSRSSQHAAPIATTTYTCSRASQARQSYDARDRGSSEYYRPNSQHRQWVRETSRDPSRDSPLPHAARERPAHKSPRGRQYSQRYNDQSDLKSPPSYSRTMEYTPRANRSGQQDWDYSRYPQTRDSFQTNYYPPQHSSPYRGRSSPSNGQRKARIEMNKSFYSPGNPKKSNKTQSRVQNSNAPLTASSSGKKEVKYNQPTLSSRVKEQCSICLNDVTDKVSLECNHSFCYECLVKWCATKETCPLCRTKITDVKEMKHGLPNQRMYGSFRCTCGNRWKSTYTYSGIKQGCRVCGQEVEAYRQCPRRQTAMQIPSLFGFLHETPEKNSLHKQELCGMCKLLGRDCSRPDNSLDEEDLLDMVALENLMSLFNLSDAVPDADRPEDDFLSLTFSDNEDWAIDGITYIDLLNGGDYDELSYDNESDFDYDEDSYLNSWQ